MYLAQETLIGELFGNGINSGILPDEVMMSKDDKMLTTVEVAGELRVTARMVRKYISAGEFPNSKKLAGKTTTYLIPRSDVDAYVAARKKRLQPEGALALLGPSGPVALDLLLAE